MKDISGRRAAREFAFQFLYQMQFQDLFPDNGKVLSPQELHQELQLLAHAFEETASVQIGHEARSFALELLACVLPHLNEIPEKISPYLQSWKWDRLQKVDATILTLAAGEMLYYKQTPLPVVIVEAIELAKKYGGKDSPAFINAIVDQLGKE